MVMATAFYVWNEASVGNSIQGYMVGGAIGGFVLALVLMFKPGMAQYLAPAYALLEGLVIGSISAIYNNAFAKVAPGIVTQAVVLTFGTAIAMYFLYTFRIIRVTERFRSIMFAAIGWNCFVLLDNIYFISFRCACTRFTRRQHVEHWHLYCHYSNCCIEFVDGL